MARWIERLQQYDFEVIYRKGEVHKNADGLSRRPCEEDSCNYCTRIETKEGKVVNRIIFEIDKQQEWRLEQLKDPIVSIFLLGKEIGKRPEKRELERNETARIYFNYWESLFVENGVLYKKWISSNLEINFWKFLNF